MFHEESTVLQDPSKNEGQPFMEPKKPTIYDKCVTCPDIGRFCNGPNMLILPILDVREIVRRRKMATGMTVDKLADKSGIPKTTVERFLRGAAVSDFKYTTVSAIVRAVIAYGAGADLGDNPCPAAAHEIKEAQQEYDALLQKKDEEIADLAERLATLRGSHNEQLAAMSQDSRRRENFLKQLTDELRNEVKELKAESRRKNRVILILCAVILVVFCLLLGYVSLNIAGTL